MLCGLDDLLLLSAADKLVTSSAVLEPNAKLYL